MKRILANICLVIGFLSFFICAYSEEEVRFILRSGCSDEPETQEPPHHNKLNSCVPSRAAINNYEPKVFPSSNNLLRRNGQNAIFCGEKIIIKGRVVDSSCVPVSDAKVYLWQVGCDGKYHYDALRNQIDRKKLNLDNHASTFQSAGTATTNNNGEFIFITTYPALSDHKSPYVNFRVAHRDLGEIQTKFFPSKNQEDNESDENSYYIEIVMHKKSKHHRY